MNLLLLFLICWHAHGSDFDILWNNALLKEASDARQSYLSDKPHKTTAVRVSCWRRAQADIALDHRYALLAQLKREPFMNIKDPSKLQVFAEPILDILTQCDRKTNPTADQAIIEKEAENMLSDDFHLNPSLFMQAFCFLKEIYSWELHSNGNAEHSKWKVKYMKAYHYLLSSCYEFCDNDNSLFAELYYQYWQSLVAPKEDCAKYPKS
ncbi:MAG: hypothetical protein OXC30_00700 [Alphaproteobacteria bacterium]|nr:hypothetical protein [Alphaproteobacteria bacterium]